MKKFKFFGMLFTAAVALTLLAIVVVAAEVDVADLHTAVVFDDSGVVFEDGEFVVPDGVSSFEYVGVVGENVNRAIVLRATYAAGAWTHVRIPMPEHLDVIIANKSDGALAATVLPAARVSNVPRFATYLEAIPLQRLPDRVRVLITVIQ